MKTFDSLTGDLDDETELAADWFPASASDAKCAMDPSHILCFDKENALLRHAVLGKQVRSDGFFEEDTGLVAGRRVENWKELGWSG